MTIAIAVLIALCAFAEPQQGKVDSVAVNEETIITDKTAGYVKLINASPNDPTQMVIYDGEKYIVSKGEIMTFDEYEQNIKQRRYNEEDKRRSVRDKARIDSAVPLFLIGFGFPCCALVIALILWIWFINRRNKQRNELIAKAIDEDYKLPESFYTRQPTFPRYTVSPSDPTNDSQQANCTQTQPVYMPQIQPRIRDGKSWRTAITLISIGIPLFLFFLIQGSEQAAVLIGGIPVFLGIGKLVAYYAQPFGPGSITPNSSTSRNGVNPNNPFNSYRPVDYPQSAPENNFQQPQQPQEPAACPPPFNPENNRRDGYPQN